MTNTRTTATDHPTTLPVNTMRTTDTDNPAGVETEQVETEQPADHRNPMLSFADPFDEQLEAGHGTTIRVPELVNVMLGTDKRPDAVSLRIDHPERMTLTVYAINGQAVKPPIDLKERAEVIEDGEHGTLFVFDIGAEAKLPIDVWLGAVGGAIRFTGTYIASNDLAVSVEPEISAPTAVVAPAVDVISPDEAVEQALHEDTTKPTPATHPAQASTKPTGAGALARDCAPAVKHPNPRPIPSEPTVPSQRPSVLPRLPSTPPGLPHITTRATSQKSLAWAVSVLGQQGAETVPESEARAPAGLQPHPSEGERHIRLILIGAAKAALHRLVDDLDERNAARSLSQIGKTALDLRKTLARFDAHAFPEIEGHRLVRDTGSRAFDLDAIAPHDHKVWEKH